MRKRRSWVSLLVFCTLTVAGSALAFAVLIAGASVALATHKSVQVDDPPGLSTTTPPTSAHTFSGMITDSRCGARHMRSNGQNSADCARACVRKGSTYVLVDGSRRYTLVGEDSGLAELAGQRAKVTGSRQGDTITVSAAAPLF